MEPTNSGDMSSGLAELAKALAKAQGAMGAAKKDAMNPHFKSKYADLAAVWDAIRAPLADNGLSVVQRVTSAREGVTVETILLHASGEWVRDRCWLPVAQQTPQAYGSAITYARRYSLSALVGVAADEDDDGNAASDGPNQGRREARPQQAARRAEAPRPKDAMAKKAEAMVEQIAAPPPAAPEPARRAELLDVKPGESEDAAKARRARAKRVWDAARASGMDGSAFKAWTVLELGTDKASNDWTDDDLEKLEAGLRAVADVPF